MSLKQEDIFPKWVAPQYQCPICGESYLLSNLKFKCECADDLVEIVSDLIGNEDGQILICPSSSVDFILNPLDEEALGAAILIKKIDCHQCNDGSIGIAMIDGFIPVEG